VRRHELDPLSLVAGLLLVALGAWFVVDGGGWARLDLRWFAPLVLLGLGTAGLIVALGRTDDPPGPVP
jgi:hypothetical protein